MTEDSEEIGGHSSGSRMNAFDMVPSRLAGFLRLEGESVNSRFGNT
jgi:hypothetical protein